MMQRKRISYAIGSILLLGTSVSASACNPLKAKCIIGLLPVSHNELNKIHQSIERDMVATGKATLTRAQHYTDNEISQAKNDTKNYTDQQVTTAQGAAQDYTDRIHQSIERDIVTAGKVTLTRAQHYTNNEISQAKNDTKNYTDQQVTTAQGAAQDYTDRIHQSIEHDMITAGNVTLTRAQHYTDNEISQAKNDAKSYTDQGDKLTLTQANHYTDSKIADAHDNVKKYSEQLNQAESSARLHADQAEVLARNEGDQKEQAARLDGDQKEQRARAQADYAETIARANGDKQTLASANRYTDEKINHTESRLNAGIAAVTAISSIPYVHGNTFSYGVGIGNYRNGNAAALGIQYRITNNINARINASWDSSHNTALGFGLAAGW
ncbi:YadA C-terminal domain-containing protein [Edwardsiella tarda]|uniref:YadA C-terminal domain-containing protein n=1 Tax=Edwardsiella tarda TaxID=636 RepID=UPI00351BFE97